MFGVHCRTDYGVGRLNDKLDIGFTHMKDSYGLPKVLVSG